MKKISIVILNYNGLADTIDCLSSLKKIKQAGFVTEIIVVDNGSKEKIKVIKIRFPETVLIESHENLGFAGGNNLGIKKALESKADYVMLLNNDTTVDPLIILKLIEFSERNKDIGIVSPKIYFYPGQEYHKDRYKEEEKGKVIWYGGGKIDWNNLYASHLDVDKVDDFKNQTPAETDFATGCCMLIKKEVFSKIGLLDDKYFLYFEDTDFSLRAKKAGIKVFFYPEGLVWHKNASSSGKPGSNLHIYYQTRNRLIFGMKYAFLRTKIALLRESIGDILKGGVKKSALIDFYSGKYGKKN
ncbi:MAG: putative glycosyltransferase [Candidatus Gottesmanbacteria bacterium GW2011_GWC2_39_8]|uniref:Putative glycosyltransferase n=1 Tax=Candidatus Gottesmanbacteria bacterium GW2011_GWC2_39_8 TaxID=1618450 RepID=A0A0G0Q2G5_9BACT|nr:MAG: putative glycosyltransferase [Candidatus Gottesmanbacteria bacterium GW2011_GWC2_39_8]